MYRVELVRNSFVLENMSVATLARSRLSDNHWRLMVHVQSVIPYISLSKNTLIVGACMSANCTRLCNFDSGCISVRLKNLSLRSLGRDARLPA